MCSFKTFVETQQESWRSLHIGACLGSGAMSGFSKNAQCVLKILGTADSLTTVEILEIARKEEFSELCHDCAGGDSFVVAANQLVEQGLIMKKFGKGGYRWQLKRD
jgi:hypothetical protein